jgi:hypothetical protein
MPSNLVPVPVFVFVHNGLQRRVSAAEERCHRDDESTFRALKPDQPYLPRGCFEGDVKDLAARDFRLLVDDVPQEIKGFERKQWPLIIRDNLGNHAETSDRPSGVWSTGEIPQAFLPDSESYYVLGFAPVPSHDGCHRIRVKVDRTSVDVYARDKYCTGQTTADLLAGTRTGDKLAHDLAEKGRGKIPLFVQAGGLRASTGRQLADIVVEFPSRPLYHQWDTERGRLYLSVGVLGAVYAADGRLVARFSDLMWPSYWPTIAKGWQEDSGEMDTFYADSNGGSFDNFTLDQQWGHAWIPYRYEKQLELGPGKYTLRVVLSDGVKTGRAEAPLTIENTVGKPLALGSVFLCSRFRDARVAAAEAAAADFAPSYVPLASKDKRVSPDGDLKFVPDERMMGYFEIYAPGGAAAAGKIQAHLRVVDAKSGAVARDFPAEDVAPYEQAGSTAIRVVREVALTGLAKGDYRVQVEASDAGGHSASMQSESFTIE